MTQDQHPLISIAHRLIQLAGQRRAADDLALPPLDLSQLSDAVSQLDQTTAADIESAIQAQAAARATSLL